MTVRNRVWDTAEPGLVTWVTEFPDATGAQYPGPGTFGVDTSDYCVSGGAAVVEGPPALLRSDLFDPVSYWSLNGVLTDTLGTEDVALASGTEQYADGPVAGTQAFDFDGSTDLLGSSTPAPAALRILGNLTVQCLAFPVGAPGGGQPGTFLACTGGVTSDTEPNNALWWPRIIKASSPYRLEWTHESTSGANETLSQAAPGIPQDEWVHVAVVVITDGGAGATEIYIYANGVSVASGTTFDPAVDGSSARVRMGRVPGGADPFAFTGRLSSCKVIDRALTQAEVIAEYKRLIPEAQR